MRAASLYVMSARTESIRSLAAARIWLALVAWRPNGLRLDRVGRWVTIEIASPWYWLLALGIAHAWVWWTARILARRVAVKLGVDLEIKVRCRHVGRKIGRAADDGAKDARKSGAGNAIR